MQDGAVCVALASLRSLLAANVVVNCWLLSIGYGTGQGSDRSDKSETRSARAIPFLVLDYCILSIYCAFFSFSDCIVEVTESTHVCSIRGGN